MHIKIDDLSGLEVIDLLEAHLQHMINVTPPESVHALDIEERDGKMRQNIEFPSKGLVCRGWLYVPDNLSGGETAPGIVMAHGFAGVKEMGLAGFAERFAAAGFVILVFDYRFWGESEGEPRNQIFALEMVEDYRNGITWLWGWPSYADSDHRSDRLRWVCDG